MSDTSEETYIKELETTVEGLENQLRDAEGESNRLYQEIERYQKRYQAAVTLITSRVAALNTQRDAYQKLAKVFTDFRQEVDNCTEQVRDLRNVPLTSLDDAVERVANRLGSAIDRI